MIVVCRISLVVGRYVSSLFTFRFFPVGSAVVLIGWNLVLLSLFCIMWSLGLRLCGRAHDEKKVRSKCRDRHKSDRSKINEKTLLSKKQLLTP